MKEKENQKKDWMDVTLQEIYEIKDIRKRIQYRKKCEFCLTQVIKPLYVNIKNKKGFSFSKPDEELTCRTMIKDLMSSYNNNREFLRVIKEG